jgi:hypothetical protein
MSKQIQHNELETLLSQGKVKFSFTRTDGSMRDAEGTSNLELIPKDHHPKGGKGPTGTCYFDSEKTAWRCVAVTAKIFI